MTLLNRILKPIVTAFCLILVFSVPVFAQSERLDQLFTELSDVETPDWERVVSDIWREWSHSGSSAMDLLLERGRSAMQAGEFEVAIEHLTALTDHAPEFAEGWNARATAYFQAGLFGPSIDDIKRTLALNPRHFGALSGLGMIMEQLELPEKALSAYRQVQAIHPHSRGIEDIILRLEEKVGGTSL
ncbi:MAG: tetratricopeptide repeat protein [Paracoccaceae bacterium]